MFNIPISGIICCRCAAFYQQSHICKSLWEYFLFMYLTYVKNCPVFPIFCLIKIFLLQGSSFKIVLFVGFVKYYYHSICYSFEYISQVHLLLNKCLPRKYIGKANAHFVRTFVGCSLRENIYPWYLLMNVNWLFILFR